jgi:hypothetical protein
LEKYVFCGDKIMKRLAYLSLLLVMLTACGKTPDKVVNVESGATPDQQALMQDATKQLVTACTGLTSGATT